MSTVRPNLKAFAYFGRSSGDYVASTGFAVLTAKEETDSRFILYSILSEYVADQIEQYVVGSNYPAINSTDVKRLRIPRPPLPEQRKIARILSTVDDLIERTEALIAKYRAIKQGLMHDLLTRGVDASGRLRPPRAEAPGLYRESAVGWVPREWEVATLGSVADVGNGVTLGRKLTGSGMVELPYLRVANVQDGYLDMSEIKLVQVLQSEIPRYSLEPGDMLMTEGGDWDKLGRGVVWQGQIHPCLHQNHIFRVRANQSILRPKFLEAVSGSSYGKRYFVRSSKQTTNLATINSTQLKAFPVPCPSIAEQDRIVALIAAYDAPSRCEQEHRDKLSQIKAGLMQDLLTGRVRVGRLDHGGAK
jgi:type I restriction enzyme S subunit